MGVLNCFVMMPSGNHGEYEGKQREADFIFSGIIAPSVHAALGPSVQIIREVDNRASGAINHEIIRKCAQYDIAIVDITGHNPNVFFEVGIRYALRPSTTILLRQPDTLVPFDLSTYRCVEYEPRFDGIEIARRNISESLKTATDGTHIKCDSPVFDVFPNLIVEIPGILFARQPLSPASMSWEEYWVQLNRIVAALKDQFENGRYVPNVLVGITNDGMLYADLLSRQVFHGVPIAALWANRLHGGRDYFPHEPNNSMLAGISKLVEKDSKEILIVDDIVASGTTITQALLYFRSRIPDASLSFLPLVSRNEKYIDLFRDSLIWLKSAFRYTEEQALAIHLTNREKLPYQKDIRSS